MMNRRTNPVAGRDVTLMDELVRTGLPEIKLALGDAIDRENERPLPPKYARLLPETLLGVVLRADAAEALRPIAADVERELTDSCNRHGSLYDRSYRVELQRTDDPDAALYTVVALRTGNEEGASQLSESAPTGGAAPDLPRAAAPVPESSADAEEGWGAQRWMLIVERDGEAREAFRILEPQVTIGRTASDPALRPNIAISDAPRVSRRQLVLRWQDRDGAPGFRLYNVGLNSVHLSGREISGAGVRGDLDQLESVGPEHTGWLPPGVPLRIGDEGLTLLIEEVPAQADSDQIESDVPVDPDATVFGS